MLLTFNLQHTYVGTFEDPNRSGLPLKPLDIPSGDGCIYFGINLSFIPDSLRFLPSFSIILKFMNYRAIPRCFTQRYLNLASYLNSNKSFLFYVSFIFVVSTVFCCLSPYFFNSISFMKRRRQRKPKVLKRNSNGQLVRVPDTLGEELQPISSSSRTIQLSIFPEQEGLK